MRKLRCLSGLFTLLSLLLLNLGCDDTALDVGALRAMTTSPVRTDRTYLRDSHNRYLMLNGVNVGGSTKLPFTVNPLSYVGRPFPRDAADRHFAQIRALGFNAVRLLWIWEAVEPNAKWEYDEEFLDFFEHLIASAQEHGLYVLVNMHENLFSRHLFARYNEDTTPYYRAYCRDAQTGELDLAVPCTSDNDCAVTAGRCNKPAKEERSAFVDALLSALPAYDARAGVDTPADELFSDRVAGDGAPLWAVQACLPEKRFDDRAWGTVRLLGQLSTNLDSVLEVMDLFGGSGGPEIDLAAVVSSVLQGEVLDILPTQPERSADLLPWTNWGLNGALSIDVQRCYAALYAGDTVFPGLRYRMPDGGEVSVKDYLQDSVARAWAQIAKRAGKYDNVIGYDLINEPLGAFVTLTALAAVLESGGTQMVRDLVEALAGPDLGGAIADLAFGLQLLPSVPDRPDLPGEPEVPRRLEGESDTAFDQRLLQYEQRKVTYDEVTLPQYEQAVAQWEPQRDEAARQWGMAEANLGALAGMMFGLDKNYLQPLYERLSHAILQEDPSAVIWIEGSMGLNLLLGESTGGGMWEMNMTRPQGVEQVVYAPHWYPDIYPWVGFNVHPRQFTAEEWEYRDWTDELQAKAHRARYSLGNTPVVFGEFGTYFNLNGIDWSVQNNYRVSEQILDNYYEAFESLNLSRMLWCYTADNDRRYGDRWNHEDFSVLDFNGKPRGERVFNRPFARALSGKLLRSHFHSDLHYFDPAKGEANAEHEFLLELESKESDAPTEIHVPRVQYPEGFYVWLSDGYAVYDDEQQTLYYFPTRDEPGHVHRAVIRPPQVTGSEIRDNTGWRYFFRGDQVLERSGEER